MKVWNAKEQIRLQSHFALCQSNTHWQNTLGFFFVCFLKSSTSSLFFVYFWDIARCLPVLPAFLYSHYFNYFVELIILYDNLKLKVLMNVLHSVPWLFISTKQYTLPVRSSVSKLRHISSKSLPQCHPHCCSVYHLLLWATVCTSCWRFTRRVVISVSDVTECCRHKVFFFLFPYNCSCPV